MHFKLAGDYTHTYFMHIYIHIFFFIYTHTLYIQRRACNSIPNFSGMPKWTNIVRLWVPELTTSMIIALMLRLRSLVWNRFRTPGVGAELHCSTKKKAPYNFTESGRAAKWYCLETAQSNSHCVSCLVSLSVSNGMLHENVVLSKCEIIKIFECSETGGLRKESKKLCFPTREVTQELISAILKMVQYSVWWSEDIVLECLN